jgi:hypothetical protein
VGAEAPAPGPPAEVWHFEDHPGFRRAIDQAGAIAAPLLAGFSFTLFALVVPSLGSHSTTIVISGHRTLISEGNAFSAVPELAAGLFLLAGLLLIFSVQATILLRYHNHSPSELAEWYPEYFPDAHGEEAPASARALPGWDSPGWPAMRVGSNWFGGFPREYLAKEIPRADRAASWMRRLYHGGILALLVGLTALVWPPAGEGDLARSALVMLGALGVLVEFVWVAGPTMRQMFGCGAADKDLPDGSGT